MTVRLVTDSTCDLPAATVEALDIVVVPLTVSFGEESFREGVDITPEVFYQKLVASPQLPKTSQPSVASFKDAYASLATETEEIVSIHLSSRLSGTLNSASIAREEADRHLRIELIDSYQVSVGLGVIVNEAAAAAKAGASLADVVDVARTAMDRVKVTVAVDTMEFLKRGGRVSRLQSLFGSLLSIKPILQVADGEAHPFERVRTRAKAMQRLQEISLADQTLQKLVIASTSDASAAYALADAVKPKLPHTIIELAYIGSVVGTHVGPGAVGIATLRRGGV